MEEQEPCGHCQITARRLGVSYQRLAIMHNDAQHQKQTESYDAGVAASRAASVDSSTGLDHREVVWPKLQVLKDKYLQDMKELFGLLTQRSTMPMTPENLQKLKHYKDVLQRMIPYLTVPKERLPREFNLEKVEAYEKQIVNIMEIYKRRRQAPGQQPALPPQQQLQPNSDWIVVPPQPPQQQQAQQQQVLQQQQQGPSLQHIISQIWKWQL